MYIKITQQEYNNLKYRGKYHGMVLVSVISNSTLEVLVYGISQVVLVRA